MKLKKNNKGITLIALVITIIVLLILAGISIATLTGENGVITKANSAKTETIHATVREEIVLKESTYELEKATDGYKGSFIEYLEKEKILQDNGDGTYKIDITKLIGEKQVLGNGTGSRDVYKLEKISETENYVVNYYDKNEDKTKIIDLGNSDTGKSEEDDKEPEQMEPTEIYAKVYSDGTTIFSSYDYVDNSHGEVVKSFSTEELCKIYTSVPPDWLELTGTGASGSTQFKNVIIQDKIAPTSTAYWFKESVSVSGVDKLITNNVTDMSEMFSGDDIEKLDLSNFDTSSVTSMRGMFSGRSVSSGVGSGKLKELNLTSFNTSKVTDMSSMFWGCGSLVTLDLSSFDVSETTRLNNIFYGCTSIKNII